MTFTDTHAHLYAEEFATDRKTIVQRSIESGVTKMFLPNIDVHSIQPMLNVVWDFPDHCYPMMGLHPCSVDAQFEVQLYQIHKWFTKRKFYAIGEIGLDYYWSFEFKEQQILSFKKQVQWAIQLDLPVVIHARNSLEDIISIIREMKHPKLRGIFHCFSGAETQANEIIDLGFYLGIGGVLTFKNSGLETAIQHIPVAHMVLETDAPYLAPVPHRGKRNESAYIPIVAEKLARIKNLSVEEIAKITTSNAHTVFGVS